MPKEVRNMAAKQHERTFKMMEDFIPLHNEGYSVKDIAERYNLSLSSVYKKLGAIAEKAGVSRKELLEKPIVADHSGRNFTPVKPIDKAKFNETFESLMAGVDSIQSQIGSTIDDIDTMNILMEEEMK